MSGCLQQESAIQPDEQGQVDSDTGKRVAPKSWAIDTKLIRQGREHRRGLLRRKAAEGSKGSRSLRHGRENEILEFNTEMDQLWGMTRPKVCLRGCMAETEQGAGSPEGTSSMSGEVRRLGFHKCFSQFYLKVLSLITHHFEEF